mmetsp:Transcript_36384/g.95649  ORF Transcript_36384/g.95649 Transcript_36384/m.95649 type:complete len:284 (-) Transcript_36384:151-1002(-)
MRPAYTRASPPSPALSIEQRGGALLQALAGRADQAEDVALVFVAELLLRVDVLQHAAAPHAEGAVRDEVVETQVRSRHVPEDEGGGVVRPLLRDVGRVAVRLLHHLHPAVKVDAARRAWLPKPHRQARDHLDQADRALRLHAVPPHVPVVLEALVGRVRVAAPRAQPRRVRVGPQLGQLECFRVRRIEEVEAGGRVGGRSEGLRGRVVDPPLMGFHGRVARLPLDVALVAVVGKTRARHRVGQLQQHTRASPRLLHARAAVAAAQAVLGIEAAELEAGVARAL